MPEKSKRSSLVDSIPLMDKRKAMKFIVYGLMAAILFGLIMMISRSISDNAGSWANMADQENYINYWSGLYGYNDYIQTQENIDRIQYWMGFQDVIFMNIARVGINIALVFILVGFLSFAVADSPNIFDYIGNDFAFNYVYYTIWIDNRYCVLNLIKNLIFFFFLFSIN
jgi:hypothetical protein